LLGEIILSGSGKITKVFRKNVKPKKPPLRQGGTGKKSQTFEKEGEEDNNKVKD